jgi:hypothetical protein
METLGGGVMGVGIRKYEHRPHAKRPRCVVAKLNPNEQVSPVERQQCAAIAFVVCMVREVVRRRQG